MTKEELNKSGNQNAGKETTQSEAARQDGEMEDGDLDKVVGGMLGGGGGVGSGAIHKAPHPDTGTGGIHVGG